MLSNKYWCLAHPGCSVSWRNMTVKLNAELTYEK